MSRVILAGPVAILQSSQAAVSFTKNNFADTAQGTSQQVAEFQNKFDIAPWGEDNQFPQKIATQLEYYGIGKSGLDWKARVLYGGGIVPGKIIGYDEKKGAQFQPLDRKQFKDVYKFLEGAWHSRFCLEYLQDWVTFANCFPEVILNEKGDKIERFVHQESCDARFQQMDAKGQIKKVFLSKFWGASEDQIAKFDKSKSTQGLRRQGGALNLLEAGMVKQLDCVDMYNPVNSLRRIAGSLNRKGLKSAILPTNYPSPNKTYYQLAAWDGARLSGWIEIAIKIPAMVKVLYKKAFKLKYHIEIPETFFHKKFGPEKWMMMTAEEKTDEKRAVLREMDDFLTGDEAAYHSFVSFFDIDNQKGDEVGRIKITAIKDETNIDKELLTGSAADTQFLIAAGINPTIFGAGKLGTGQQRSGGSDIRESFLVYLASLKLEREVMLAPWYLVRDYNGWDPEITFRISDTVLTTLDTGAGTQKTLS